MTIVDKYDRTADGFTERNYPDAHRYLGRKAALVVSLGTRLEPGDLVLELGCADGGLAEPLLARDLRYRGADLSPGMVEAARRRLGRRADVEVGDMNAYRPPEHVAATVMFRALYYTEDRVALFRHIRSFTDKKLVFDFTPRRFVPAQLREELSEAGFSHVIMRPFLIPTSHRLPAAAYALLERIERMPRLARLVLRFRFTYLCAAT